MAHPPRPVTNAWQATKWWNVYVALTTVVVAVLVVVGESARPIEPRVGSAVTVLAIGAWYALRGRPLLAGAKDSRALWVFLTVTAVLYGVATVLASSASFLSIALIPLIFNLTELRPGIIAVSGLNLIPPVANVVRTGDLVETLVVLVPIAIVITVFSSVFAIWVHQIVRQSIERADLIEQLAASRAEVARLSRDAGMAAERQRLSAEIHDTIAQGLSSVVMLVQAAAADLDRDAGRARHHLEMAGRTARESLAEARALVAGLSPAQLSGASLAAVLARLAERFHEETGVPVDARTAAPPAPLPMTVEVVLLRAAQEGLANVRKHAGATAVTLELAYRPGAAELTITDNGVGVTGTEGFGLAGMRARAADVGGTLRVEPAPGGGTRLTVLVPA